MYDLISIDWGEKKLGIALGSSNLKITLPQPVLHYNDEAEILTYIKKLIDEKNINKIIVGYPTNFKGEKTSTSVKIDRFIKFIKQNFSFEIIKIGERNSTKNADKLLANYGKNKTDEDSVAATILLNQYLDEQ